ncbi:hypothetical protein RB195_018671 [Necator americanus]|uniref:Endonuclease/exonuclease/phosphatase domain-containing protein n=1 Tax=Necator americanus TaxID=51031 RepID=A0ABR1CBX0_NECAM
MNTANPCLLQLLGHAFELNLESAVGQTERPNRKCFSTDENTNMAVNIDSFKQLTTRICLQKPSSPRWTESPGGLYDTEIDHIIVSKRFSLTDVAVVPKFFAGSDHRRLRGRLSFIRTIIDWDLFASLVEFWEDTAMDNIDDEYDRLVEHLHN